MQKSQLKKHCTLIFKFELPYDISLALLFNSYIVLLTSVFIMLSFFVTLQNLCVKPAITAAAFQLNYTISRTHNKMDRSQVPHASNSYGGLWVTRVVFMCVYLDIFVPSLSFLFIFTDGSKI